MMTFHSKRKVELFKLPPGSFFYAVSCAYCNLKCKPCMMKERPKIKLVLSAFDKLLEIIGIVLLVLLWVGVIYAYITLPDSIPIHFNIAGKPDAYGGKFSLIVLAFVATILYAGLTLLCRIPHHFNYLVQITESNAGRQYRWSTRIIRYIKVAIVILFGVIIMFVHLTARGLASGIGPWFLPLIFMLFVFPVIVSIWYSAKDR
jgi:uncharacterized membrane protein